MEDKKTLSAIRLLAWVFESNLILTLKGSHMFLADSMRNDVGAFQALDEN